MPNRPPPLRWPDRQARQTLDRVFWTVVLIGGIGLLFYLIWVPPK